MTNAKIAARVLVSKDGPYVIAGHVPLAKQTICTDADGGSEKWEEGDRYPTREEYACVDAVGRGKKPFCDGTHTKIGFDGTETASRKSFVDQANVFDGPSYQLMDVESLCAFARFCDPNGKVWNQVTRTDEPDLSATFLRQVGNCPAGRLVALDKATGRSVEPQLPVSIGLVEDPQEECSGPIWLRGGIKVVSADGFEYETRNRVTLCRCGHSNNKPFCDGAHTLIKSQSE